MGRRKDSIEKKQRRFLLPLLQFTTPAIVLMIALPMIEDALCQFLYKQAESAACRPMIPAMIWYALWGMFVLGICLSGWRFYRDHMCGEAYSDFY